MEGADLLRLVEAIHRERNVDKELLFQGLEHALLTAARKRLGESASISVTIDRTNGEVRVITPSGELDLPDLGRIAAQNARQVFGQIIREAEREVIFSEYDRFQRQLVNGTVYRIDGTAVIVQLGKSEGYLPKHEQVRGETYRVGDRVLCYVVEVKKIGNRVKIILSRSHPDMIRRLFEREIPEIADGVVEIVKLVREAGYKTKAACQSMDPKVDPIGACVGLRGTRIKNIIDELNGEKIDIIRWNDSPEVLIVKALKPAQINSITLYEETRRALVAVEEDQLSLAIGKKGANVRLASKLSDWAIDIMSETEARERGLFDEPAQASAIEVGESGEVIGATTITPAPAGDVPMSPPVVAPDVESSPAVEDEAPVLDGDVVAPVPVPTPVPPPSPPPVPVPPSEPHADLPGPDDQGPEPESGDADAPRDDVPGQDGEGVPVTPSPLENHEPK
jgi:N utilization substance protein A